MIRTSPKRAFLFSLHLLPGFDAQLFAQGFEQPRELRTAANSRSTYSGHPGSN